MHALLASGQRKDRKRYENSRNRANNGISASFMRRTAHRASWRFTFWTSREKCFWIFSLRSQIGRKVFSTNFTSCPSTPLHMSSKLSQHYRYVFLVQTGCKNCLRRILMQFDMKSLVKTLSSSVPQLRHCKLSRLAPYARYQAYKPNIGDPSTHPSHSSFISLFKI